MATRFQTRTFLLCFVPFSFLLAATFWMAQKFVPATVRDGLHSSLRENQAAIATIHDKIDIQNSRRLKDISDNTALQSEILQFLSPSKQVKPPTTIEEHLRVLGELAGFDFVLVSKPDGSPLAGVVRRPIDDQFSGGKLASLDTTMLLPSDSDFRVIGGRTLQTASVPISRNGEKIATLSAGRDLDLSVFTTPVALVSNGKVVDSTVPQISFEEITRALAQCTDHSECDVNLRGASWISVPLQTYSGGYVFLSFENVDRAVTPVQSRLDSLFVSLFVVATLIAFLCSFASSRNIVKPVSAVVAHLRNAARTGVLSEMKEQSSSIREIRELANFYNRAAVSVRAAHADLEAASLEFVGSLANALDARDPYTAGHSLRVSKFSCAIASEMQLDPYVIERIRVGALLHDIGKIGVSDIVLRKPGRLTKKEQAMVREHPVIGRRILEGVHGFAPYLPVVELHHENWDGSGYPHGKSGDETPVEARIIHVADAYDAMTTVRPYRRGLTHDEAISELIEYSGRQFDPKIVEIFVSFPRDFFPVNTVAPPEESEQELCTENGD
jgi:HD-GYP domain-containing protein (c-di-GMP phosphodiesterase class II)